MAVYLVTSIFETEPGQFKKYTMAYDSLNVALEYVELDMSAQYDGIYAEVLTDDVKELIRMRGDFYFKYGEMPHYIMIERLDILGALPENVDNVVRFSLSEHMIEPLEGEELAADAAEENNEDGETDTTTDGEEEIVEETVTENVSNGNNAEEEEENVSNANNAEEEEEIEEETEESAVVEPPVEEENGLKETDSKENTIEVGENGTSDVPSINGLEDEEAPVPETIPMNNSESTVDVNMASSTSNSTAAENTESNIPAALRTSSGGKRRTRRKGGKGKRATRKV